MIINNQVTDEAVLHELGARLARVRLDRNLTQAELANHAGVSQRTVERLEAGNSVQLSSLIRLCRALDLLPRFEPLVPEPVPSPIAQLKSRGKTRRRASARKTTVRHSRQWEWGNEA